MTVMGGKATDGFWERGRQKQTFDGQARLDSYLMLRAISRNLSGEGIIATALAAVCYPTTIRREMRLGHDLRAVEWLVRDR
jgi:hypothetical protein